AFRKGVFNYIKEETDRLTNEAIPRKYFSGGVDGSRVRFLPANGPAREIPAKRVAVRLDSIGNGRERNAAQLSRDAAGLSEQSAFVHPSVTVRNLWREIEAAGVKDPKKTAVVLVAAALWQNLGHSVDDLGKLAVWLRSENNPWQGRVDFTRFYASVAALNSQSSLAEQASAIALWAETLADSQKVPELAPALALSMAISGADFPALAENMQLLMITQMPGVQVISLWRAATLLIVDAIYLNRGALSNGPQVWQAVEGYLKRFGIDWKVDRRSSAMVIAGALIGDMNFVEKAWDLQRETGMYQLEGVDSNIVVVAAAWLGVDRGAVPMANRILAAVRDDWGTNIGAEQLAALVLGQVILGKDLMYAVAKTVEETLGGGVRGRYPSEIVTLSGERFSLADGQVEILINGLSAQELAEVEVQYISNDTNRVKPMVTLTVNFARAADGVITGTLAPGWEISMNKQLEGESQPEGVEGEPRLRNLSKFPPGALPVPVDDPSDGESAFRSKAWAYVDKYLSQSKAPSGPKSVYVNGKSFSIKTYVLLLRKILEADISTTTFVRPPVPGQEAPGMAMGEAIYLPDIFNEERSLLLALIAETGFTSGGASEALVFRFPRRAGDIDFHFDEAKAELVISLADNHLDEEVLSEAVRYFQEWITNELRTYDPAGSVTPPAGGSASAEQALVFTPIGTAGVHGNAGLYGSRNSLCTFVGAVESSRGGRFTAGSYKNQISVVAATAAGEKKVNIQLHAEDIVYYYGGPMDVVVTLQREDVPYEKGTIARWTLSGDWHKTLVDFVEHNEALAREDMQRIAQRKAELAQRKAQKAGLPLSGGPANSAQAVVDYSAKSVQVLPAAHLQTVGALWREIEAAGVKDPQRIAVAMIITALWPDLDDVQASLLRFAKWISIEGGSLDDAKGIMPYFNGQTLFGGAGLPEYLGAQAIIMEWAERNAEARSAPSLFFALGISVAIMATYLPALPAGANKLFMSQVKSEPGVSDIQAGAMMVVNAILARARKPVAGVEVWGKVKQYLTAQGQLEEEVVALVAIVASRLGGIDGQNIRSAYQLWLAGTKRGISSRQAGITAIAAAWLGGTEADYERAVDITEEVWNTWGRSISLAKFAALVLGQVIFEKRKAEAVELERMTADVLATSRVDLPRGLVFEFESAVGAGNITYFFAGTNDNRSRVLLATATGKESVEVRFYAQNSLSERLGSKNFVALPLRPHKRNGITYWALADDWRKRLADFIKGTGLVLGASAGISDSAAKQYGGIDLNAIDVNRTGEVKSRVFDAAAMAVRLKDVTGFRPVILNIAPVANWRLLLGMAAQDAAPSPADPAPMAAILPAKRNRDTLNYS
ncbi:MAG: hypothetical protein HQL20_08940, partial [Candidatus Omnitrophica bacterium]|nr:hypothetical protein [Candidatus Omnitrophota bacterium]